MNFTAMPPQYPLSAFCLIDKNAAEEVLRHTQAPDALVGMAFLTAMSASAQGLFDVRLPTGQIRPLSLNLLVIADSGERKTGVDNLVSEPIYAFDQLRLKKYKSDVEEYELQMHIWKSVDAGLRRQITRLTQVGQPIDEVCNRLSEHAARKPIKPRMRRIMRQNATERAIMDALEGDGEAIAFMSDEGEIIIKGGAFSQTGTLNKAWDGAPILTLDRSDGVSIVVRNPRVTVAYMVQRQVLKELLDRRGDTMRGSGHWARYLIGCPASTQGTRYTYQLDTNWNHLPKFQQRVRDLLDEVGQRIDANALERTILEFSDDAIACWIDLTNRTESMLTPWGYLHDIKDFASKAVEIAGRVAALLHVFSKQEGKISADTLNRAIAIVEWHLHEFKRLFSPDFAIPQQQADAQLLERYLHTHYLCRNYHFAQRNLVLRNGPVRPASRFHAALECLISAGRVWITVGPRRERYINFNVASFNSLGGTTFL